MRCPKCGGAVLSTVEHEFCRSGKRKPVKVVKGAEPIPYVAPAIQRPIINNQMPNYRKKRPNK